MPGLDGLRAIAVLGVVLYHLKFGWAEGGLLGVGVFFTLSGYLITDILLNQVNRGGIKLKSFWLARARRLLPATLPDADRGDGLGDGDRPAPAGRLPRRRAQRRRLLQQLVADLPRRLLLRPLRAALAAQPPLVALGRGAVLHRLALPADGRRCISCPKRGARPGPAHVWPSSPWSRRSARGS